MIGAARKQKELDSGVTPRLRLQSEGVSLPLSLPPPALTSRLLLSMAERKRKKLKTTLIRVASR